MPPPVLNVHVDIKLFTDSDWPGVWKILRAVALAGGTYEFPADISEEDGRQFWIRPAPAECWVAVDDGAVLGTYKVAANRSGLGDHVANGSYMVADEARGRGLGRALGEHSLERARAMGFAAMQFNAVVSTNTPALRLWRSLGFIIVGTIPSGFRHHEYGAVDFHIMHRFL
jgi:GNAT superfamily N-acetyltransferase